MISLLRTMQKVPEDSEDTIDDHVTGFGIAQLPQRRSGDRVRIPAEAAGECSSPELIFCADSYSVYVPPPCYRSGTLKTPIILPKVQVAG